MRNHLPASRNPAFATGNRSSSGKIHSHCCQTVTLNGLFARQVLGRHGLVFIRARGLRELPEHYDDETLGTHHE
jgi:hypothetical protein